MFNNIKKYLTFFTCIIVALEIRRVCEEMEREWVRNPFDENPRDFYSGFVSFCTQMHSQGVFFFTPERKSGFFVIKWRSSLCA